MWQRLEEGDEGEEGDEEEGEEEEKGEEEVQRDDLRALAQTPENPPREIHC